MAILTSNGIHICYELTGSPELPVIILAHSLGVSHAMWQPQVAALSARFRILTYDLRGHGASSVLPGQYTVADLGSDLLQLLDTLGIGKAHFCGLSMGGVLGQWLAIHAPDRLNKLILANTAAKIGSTETWNARIELVQREGLAPVIPGTLERWFTPAFHTAHPEIIAAKRILLEATDPVGYMACCAAIRDADFRAELSQISTPALVIAGTADPVTPPSDAHFLADNIPGAHCVELPAAHLSSVEAADVFNAALLDFLSA